jgi:hypothetical protein
VAVLCKTSAYFEESHVERLETRGFLSDVCLFVFYLVNELDRNSIISKKGAPGGERGAKSRSAMPVTCPIEAISTI